MCCEEFVGAAHSWAIVPHWNLVEEERIAADNCYQMLSWISIPLDNEYISAFKQYHCILELRKSIFTTSKLYVYIIF